MYILFYVYVIYNIQIYNIGKDTLKNGSNICLRLKSGNPAKEEIRNITQCKRTLF